MPFTAEGLWVWHKKSIYFCMIDILLYMNTQLQQTKQWDELKKHYADELAGTRIQSLFADDTDRGSQFAVQAEGIYLDYSKNILTDTTLSLLQNLCEQSKLTDKIADMFTGKKINTTEDRAVLHIAQRAAQDTVIEVDGKNVVSDVYTELEHMSEFASAIRDGSWLGYTGKRIRNVIHIGIGGAEIGPHMAYEALYDYCSPDLKAYFISNVDPANFYEVTDTLDPEETLVIISSKSFTTTETLTNAQSAKDWFLSHAQDESAISKHFVAISTNIETASKFGIDPKNLFTMWDWVGGRYSLMGATGLVIMILIGPDNFRKILDGARSIDNHFQSAPAHENIPIILALISLLYNNFFGAETELITPYSSRLDRFTTYMQQANMESNGKSVTLDGESVDSATGPIVWGKPGTDSQHTFMQHVHQSKRLIPTDIIAFKHAFKDTNGQHTMLIANALAQAEALAFGKDDDALRAEGVPETLIPHKRMPGNIPNNFLLFDTLSPYTLGQLIAIYEHKIFVLGALWNINSFDQWGVQLGKVLAEGILEELHDNRLQKAVHDSSTSNLLKKLST